MSALTDIDVAATPLLVEHRPWWRSRVTLSAAIVGVMIVCYLAFKGEYSWPNELTWNALPTHLNDFQTWLVDQRNASSPSVVIRAFNGFASFLDDLVTWFTDFLGWMTWVGVTVAGVLVSLRFGGARAAIWAFAAFVAFGASGLWLESMQTLALMLAAVGLSLAIGVPLGVWAGLVDRVHRVITPVLDAMQIIPAFAYLMPIVILFSVGPGAAVITTMIYAIPPAIRITALGIRGVPGNTVEAAESMGSTRRQLLFKVRLPLARRMLLLSVNQTILFALSMVVIAGPIGGKGLGDVVTSGLNSYPALALLAGIVIVVMAMALDRVTEAVAERTNPARRHLTGDLRRRLACVGRHGAGDWDDRRRPAPRGWRHYSRTTARDWLLARLQSVLDYIQNPDTILFHVTSWIGDHIVQYGLVPFRNFLVETPWPVTLIGIHADLAGRKRSPLGDHDVSDARPDRADRRVVLGDGHCLAGARRHRHDRGLGVGLGIWAAESKTFSRILRPINDVLQTLPQLVYLIPLIYLMPVSVVPGVIAGVLYAFPVVARLVESGVRNVEANTVEAAESFGATRRQVLTKVKIPLAQDAIMLGVNQGIIMVLAVVVIGGLVGSPGLGYEVAQGLARSDFGLGVLASLAILALGIALDRIRAARPGATRGTVTSVKSEQRTSSAFLQQSTVKEGRMSPRRWSRRWGRSAGGRRRQRTRGFRERACREQRQERPCGTVTMDENAWAGATANVYVLKYVLEKNLGCKVNIEKLPESTPLFQAMSDGKVDVVPEDWNNIDLKVNQKYLSSHAILRLGSNGVIGRIGWFIPTYLMKQHPEFKTWQGLKGKESIFKSPSPARRGCSSAAIPRTCKRTRS